MDMIRSRVALRERALLDVFDLAFRFCAAHARAYAKLALVVLAPAFAVSCVVAWAAGWAVAWAATLGMTAFAGVPFVALASRLVFADEASPAEALRVAARALPNLIAVRMVQGMALAASALFLGLPWLWAGSSSLFIVEVRLLERHGDVGAAIVRAHRIARARRGTSVLALVLLAAAPVAAAMVADVAGRELLGRVLEVQPPATMFVAGGSWLSLGGWWAALPLMSTARFFLYLDVRTRAEGWDIQTRFAAIVARARDRTRETPSWRPTGAALVVLALLAAPAVANAALEPARAPADVAGAIADGGYAFCRAPREPLTARARALCDHATQIADCQGFAAACGRADETGRDGAGDQPSRWWRDVLRRAAWLVDLAGTVGRIVVWLLVALVVLAVLVPVGRALSRARANGTANGTRAWARARTGERGPTAEPVDLGAGGGDATVGTDGDTLLARADELAREGRGGLALEHYLAAAVRALHQRGALQMSSDRTNGEYLRSCVDGAAAPALDAIVRDVERVSFGGQDASTDVVSRAARHATAIVRAMPPLAFLALLLLGCGGFAGGRIPDAGGDPAGDELWSELLRRQGLHVERLGGALASLPMPVAGEPSFAVVVNAERTELDRETREHLLAWVGAGDVLVLAGDPLSWPGPFRPRSLRPVTDRPLDVPSGDETEHAELANARAMIDLPSGAERVAWFGKRDGREDRSEREAYAALIAHGRGYVLAIATDELLTNAGLARARNAAAMVAVFSRVGSSVDGLRLAEDDDGVSPPSTPISVLSRAGLGIGLLHALVASVLLFLAVGTRLARPKPTPPPPSRAFAEHVEAVGALYARAGAAPHALAVYTRFAEARLRARMPRGVTDIAAFLATQAHVQVDVCRRLWARASADRVPRAMTRGEEAAALAVLEELSALYAAATPETP
jgi:hypothetical protein